MLLSLIILSSSGAKNVLYVSWAIVKGIVYVDNMLDANSAPTLNTASSDSILPSNTLPISSTSLSIAYRPKPALPTCIPVTAWSDSLKVFLSITSSPFCFLSIKCAKNKYGAAGKNGRISYVWPSADLPSYHFSPAYSEFLKDNPANNIAKPVRPFAVSWYVLIPNSSPVSPMPSFLKLLASSALTFLLAK